jgi:periplasmic protein TonB
MKLFGFLLLAMLSSQLSLAQVAVSKDTTKTSKDKKIIKPIEIDPEYPGGQKAFQNYISKKIQYPDVAELIGIDGNVVVSFTIERAGSVTHVYPVSCIGAGCESEAVKVIEGSKKWKPGIQNGKQVRVQYTVPINFFDPKDEVKLRALRNSDYGFVFNIKDTLYTIDEVQKILGKSFPSKNVEIAEPFYNYNNIEKFNMRDKKEVYLLIFKKS